MVLEQTVADAARLTERKALSGVVRQSVFRRMIMHFSTRIVCAAVVVAIAGSVGAQPAPPANPANGEKLAKRWCAECHVVAPDQSRAQADAPTFASISAGRRIPEITMFLGQSHPQMPDMSLSRSEIADLIAYMHTLAPPADPAPSGPVKDDYKPPSRG